MKQTQYEYMNSDGKKYRVLEFLGKGQNGRVSKVIDNNKNIYALKEQEDLRIIEQQFIDQIKSKSDGLLRIYEYFQHQGRFYILQEYCNQGNLEKYLKQKGQLEIKEAQKILLQLSKQLSIIHSMRYIYQDLKPENIVIKEINNKLKYCLCDFGSVINQNNNQEDRQLTQSRLGTPYYMAPESMDLTNQLDQKIDIWALGVMYYELISGKKLFDGDNKSQIFKQIKYQKPDELNQKLFTVLKVDKQKDQTLLSMFNQNPQNRSNIEQVINYLLTQKKNQLKSEIKVLQNELKLRTSQFINLTWDNQKLTDEIKQLKISQEQTVQKLKEKQQELETSKLLLDQQSKNFKIESEKYDKLNLQYQGLQIKNQKQSIEISNFEPIQLELVFKINEIEFKATQLQKQLDDAQKQIEKQNQQIKDFYKQNQESNQNCFQNNQIGNTNLLNEKLKKAQQRIEELQKSLYELEDKNYQLIQQRLDQEKKFQEELQITNKQYQEIQLKLDVQKNQVVKQNRTIEELKYQLKQKDRELEKQIKQISENFKQQQKVETSENQLLQQKLLNSDKMVKQLELEKDYLTNQCEDRIKKQNEFIEAIKLRCQKLENQQQQIQNQCNNELSRQEQKIRDQQQEIAKLSGCNPKPYTDESKIFDQKQLQFSQNVTYQIQSKQIIQIKQYPINQVQSSSKIPKVIPYFQKDLNNNKYSITLLLGRNEDGKKQIMNTLFENQKYDLYQANLEGQSQTLVINTDSFNFDDIDEREKQIKEYKKIFNQYANKQFNIWIVVPFLSADFMKKDIMDIYKYFYKLNIQISIIVTDFYLSNNQEVDETHLRSKLAQYKPREILFIGKDINKNQFITMLKSTLYEENSNNQIQLNIKNTIFEVDKEEQ